MYVVEELNFEPMQAEVELLLYLDHSQALPSQDHSRLPVCFCRFVLGPEHAQLPMWWFHSKAIVSLHCMQPCQ